MNNYPKRNYGEYGSENLIESSEIISFKKWLYQKITSFDFKHITPFKTIYKNIDYLPKNTSTYMFFIKE